MSAEWTAEDSLAAQLMRLVTSAPMSAGTRTTLQRIAIRVGAVEVDRVCYWKALCAIDELDPRFDANEVKMITRTALGVDDASTGVGGAGT